MIHNEILIILSVHILGLEAEEKDCVSKHRLMFAAASSFTRYLVTYGRGTVTTGFWVKWTPAGPPAAQVRHISCLCWPMAVDGVEAMAETDADISDSEAWRGVRGASQVLRILPHPVHTCAFGDKTNKVAAIEI